MAQGHCRAWEHRHGSDRELVKEMILTLAHERPNVYALQNLGFSEERNPYEDPRMKRAVRLVGRRQSVGLTVIRIED